MPLYLYEFAPARDDRAAVDDLLSRIDKLAAGAGARLVESQVTRGNRRVFTVVDAASADPLHATFTADALPGIAEISGPQPVRLVGADLADVLADADAARRGGDFLVEWDLPPDLDMQTYLARKREKTPRYAQVPETTFLRTYVREDMTKCLCLYHAPDEDAVRRARAAVSSPVDRLHALDGGADR